GFVLIPRLLPRSLPRRMQADCGCDLIPLPLSIDLFYVPCPSFPRLCSSSIFPRSSSVFRVLLVESTRLAQASYFDTLADILPVSPRPRSPSMFPHSSPAPISDVPDPRSLQTAFDIPCFESTRYIFVSGGLS